MSVNETQVGGKHYKAGYQHWDFVVRALRGRYLEGCATKYVTRWRKKNGIQDLQKADHYIAKILELHSNGMMENLGLTSQVAFECDEFCASNHCGTTERTIISLIATWTLPRHLEYARMLIKELIEEARLMAQPSV